MWEKRLPLSIDVNCPWGMFNAINYIPVLYGLDWFDTEKIKYEYENYGYDETIDIHLQKFHNGTFWIGHKEMIKMLKRSYYTE
jgi:hypothetical protein